MTLDQINKRRETISGNRYLIYYTFGDKSLANEEIDTGDSKTGKTTAFDSQPKPAITEERDV